jgi:predicted transcriptional regulator
MPFSVHMDEKNRRALDHLVQTSGKTRNALINEAVREFVGRRESSAWPDSVRRWIARAPARRGPRFPAFESHRRELGGLVEPKL